MKELGRRDVGVSEWISDQPGSKFIWIKLHRDSGHASDAPGGAHCSAGGGATAGQRLANVAADVSGKSGDQMPAMPVVPTLVSSNGVAEMLTANVRVMRLENRCSVIGIVDPGSRADKYRSEPTI